MARPKKPLELQMKHLTQEEKTNKELEEQEIRNLLQFLARDLKTDFRALQQVELTPHISSCR